MVSILISVSAEVTMTSAYFNVAPVQGGEPQTKVGERFKSAATETLGQAMDYEARLLPGIIMLRCVT